ncbi:dihydrodipicolinate synthase family protein [Singulisphaera acidiphila]
MARNVPFKGIIAYPITPLRQDGSVDIDKFKSLLDRLIGSGVHGIAPLGSAGILPYLSDEERESVTETTVQHVAGRLPTLVGVSALTTERAVHHARHAEQAGATAVMLIPMSYWKLTEDEVFKHYQGVAESISVPIMAYNNPATGGVDMRPEFLARLLEIPNVTMVKESTGDVRRMQQLVKLAGDDVAFFNGSNPLALAAFAAGARGWCTAAPNLIPQLTLDLYAAVENGDFALARILYYRQMPLLEFIVQGGLPRTVAAGLDLLGFDPGPLRSPLLPLPEGDRNRLSKILQSLSQDQL